MKRGIIILIVLFVAILGMWIAARAMHIIVFYRVGSPSNEPTLKQGQTITASSLKKPDFMAFLCFKRPENKSIWMFRCIGKENDVVEIRNTVVYLNGKKLNEPYIMNQYTISQKQLSTIQGYIDQYRYAVTPINDSTSLISISETDLKKYHLKLEPAYEAKGVADSQIFKDFRHLNANRDNLGPLTVPKKSYFLMGDNRHDAYDSRYIGFIKAEDVVATAINK